jgi:hypothetical protein
VNSWTAHLLACSNGEFAPHGLFALGAQQLLSETHFEIEVLSARGAVQKAVNLILILGVGLGGVLGFELKRNGWGFGWLKSGCGNVCGNRHLLRHLFFLLILLQMNYLSGLQLGDLESGCAHLLRSPAGS